MVCALALGPGALRPCQASPAEDEAEALIKVGVTLRKEGKDFEAYDYFARAYQRVQTPRTTAQLALVESALGRWVEAEEHLGTALGAEKNEWIAKNRAVLEEAMRTVEGHLAVIELRGEPAGARVVVNGKPAGQLPLGRPLRVGEGFVDVELRAEGYKTEHRTLDIKVGPGQQLFMKLEPLAIGLAAPPPPKDERSGQPGLKVAAVSLGVVGIAGIAFGINRTLRVHELNDDQSVTGGSDRASEGEQAQRQQWYGYGIGAAGLVAGGILAYFGWRDDSPRAAAAGVTLRLAVTGQGALLVGQF
jgi:hypothetical protein